MKHTRIQKTQHLRSKEKEFAKKYVENNENGIETVKEVFKIKDSNYAAVKATRLIRKANVKQEIESVKMTLKSALANEGIDEKYIAKKVNVLLKATDEKGNHDYTAIDKGLKHATTIYGVVDESDKPKSNNTYNFIFSPEVQADVKKIEENIKARLLQKHVQSNS